MSTAQDAADPFAHLHDENYTQRFSLVRTGFAERVAMAGRARQSLDGTWLFILDLFDEGLRQKWFEDEPTPPQDWTVPRDHDFGAWSTITVPSSWSMVKPEWRYFEGGAWYTRMIEIPPTAGDRLVLRIGAANYAARLFLNGVFLASHTGGSTPFFVELTRHLRGGSNRLQINVDNRRAPTRVPMHHFDWFNHGGIYREVDLLRLPTVFIRDFALQLVPNGRFSDLAFDLTLSDPVDGEAELNVPELGIEARVAVRAGRAAAMISARPTLWSPESPKLYDVSVSYDGDRVVDRIGFREIKCEGADIRLNGHSIYLRGICVHEDDADLGKVSNDADLRRRFGHAKELGCNFLRLAHYPHHERAAELADEVGLLLWEEIPVYWAIDFANSETYRDAENQLLELIHRDRNRASVVVWGIGNENADTEARYRFMADLAAAARRADMTRLIAAACLINREKFRIEDRLAQHLDLIGINEYFGWYEPSFAGLEQLLANSDPGKPVVISETGADALAGHRGGAAELFTEDAQAAIIRRQLELIAAAPYVRGIAPWLLYDFRTERRQTTFQRGFSRKGLIAEDKATKKLAFEVLAQQYRRLAEERE